MALLQRSQLVDALGELKSLTEISQTQLGALRASVDQQLTQIRESNEKKLEEMRKTVDEQLQGTLEKRLGDSFSLVSERLEAVQRGLGEMQNLATGVGDLKRALTNVKTRGTWGEFQLGAILEQILTPDQYSANVRTNENSQESVEYAIRLPGRFNDPASSVWLPIDSKFPLEDYRRLTEAAEAGNAEGVTAAVAALAATVHLCAQTICEKYLNPPKTTDFAILFLPTEGLYGEVLRQPGLVEQLQNTYRVTVAGPTTLAAILNSLRMGFKTLAIEQRASEVWNILGGIKTEFGKFGAVLDKVKSQLETAGNTIDKTLTRTRAMEKKLRDVEQLPEAASDELSLAEEVRESGDEDLVGVSDDRI
jgi:DNA recombination protein RmuC